MDARSNSYRLQDLDHYLFECVRATPFVGKGGRLSQIFDIGYRNRVGHGIHAVIP